jgi:DNA-binding NtrC family response regulator
MTKLRKALRVFVVDDEDVIAYSLAMILRYNGGFHATAFDDSVQAFEAALFEAPDLLITDVMMPKLNGVDLAIGVQAHCPECKVLLFSGHMATVHLLESVRAKGYNFEMLSKPVHPADLLARIQNLIETPPAVWAPEIYTPAQGVGTEGPGPSD